MSTEYYTTATASEGFWESLISDQLESGFPITYIGEGAGFTIKSEDYPAIKDMIELSKEHPDERFNVAVTTNDKLRDVIEYYEFQSGVTFFNHVEPLFHFDVSEEVDQKAGSEIINELKKEITESLNWLSEFVPSYEQLLGCPNRPDEMVTNFQFEYRHKDITLYARLIGHTCIEIDLEEKNNCNNNLKICQ
ncbi:MAG: hypothetical protein U9R43_18395 [Thermodesulfobacteriota bacterium]|nr:hypothetical protein [Thermodesulfobacteriota bacterium]